ncbi:MAG: serine/threonine protein kinase, partial [Opitutaceae bacterium]|nr:serine/threonine protein kinase [Opitutaceae bacterium]
VLDAGATETGRPYFVMELVPGVPITKYCDNNRLGVRERIELFMTVCQAIQHAHQKGIIHRDIKPSNVLVTLHDSRPVPMVIDFGVAKATNQRLTEKTLFTRFATMIGTPAYMSPEQAELSKLDVDTRSDIYSLGVLLYELLTGTTPFPEQRLRSVAYREMQRIISEEEPEPPSTRVAKELGLSLSESMSVASNIAPPLPPTRRGSASDAEIGETPNEAQRMRAQPEALRGDLDSIVIKCLEKDRTRRYETANSLAADLTRHLSDEPVSARPPSAAYRLQKAFRRHRVAVTAGAVVVLALLVGISLSLWQAMVANHQRIVAEEERVQAEEQRVRAESALHIITTARTTEVPKVSKARSAIAGYVRDLRANPSNHIAASRLIYSLLRRPFASPIFKSFKGGVAFSSDGLRVVVREDGGWKVWDVQTGNLLTHLALNGEDISTFAFSPDSKTILAASFNYNTNQIKILDSRSGLWLKTLTIPHGGSMHMSFSPDSRYLLTTGRRKDSDAARLWDIGTGQLLIEPLRHEGYYINDGCFSPDGQRVATAADDGTAQVWDAHTGQSLGPPLRHEAPLMRVRFSPDGLRIVTASANGTARIWDAVTGKSLTEPLLHEHTILEYAEFSPDGLQVVTACAAQVRIWNLITAQPTTADITNSTSQSISRAHFSPDGSRVLADNGLVLDARTGELLTEFERERAYDFESTINEYLWAYGFTPDGQSVKVVRRNEEGQRTAELLEIPTVPVPVSSWFLDWAEARADRRLDVNGREVSVPVEEQLHQFQQVAARTDSDFFTRVAQRIQSHPATPPH